MDLKKIISQDESETVGRPYRRVGKSTLQMSRDEYCRGVLHTPFQERSILEKHKDKLNFDSQICKEDTFNPPLL